MYSIITLQFYNTTEDSDVNNVYNEHLVLCLAAGPCPLKPELIQTATAESEDSAHHAPEHTRHWLIHRC